jgi:putative DNA primase/helicase
MQPVETTRRAAPVPASIASGDVITVIRDPKRSLGKRFVLDAEGKVVKCPQVETSFCYARMVRVPDHDALAKLLAQVAEDEHLAIINSQFKGVEVGERFIILSEAEIERRYGVKGREQTAGVHPVASDPEGCTKAVGRFGENVEPSAWQILDRDMDEHTPAEFIAMGFDAWLEQVDKLLPGVVGVGRVRAHSTSSRVLLNGRPVGGGNGHTWIRLSNPQDVERIRQLLPIQAMAAGVSWLKPRFSRKTGEVVGHSPTTIIDPSVWSKARVIFVGKPVVDGAGLTVSDQCIEHVPGLTGEVLATDALQLPLPERVREITKAAGAEMHVRSTGGSLAMDAYDLTLAMEIEIKGRGLMTVAEAADLVGPGQKLRCQTPFRASDSFAGVFSRGKDGRLFVFDSGTNTTHWLCNEDNELHGFEVISTGPLSAEAAAEQAAIKERNAEKAARIAQAAIEKANAPTLADIMSMIDTRDILGLEGRDLSAQVIGDLVKARLGSIDEETALKLLKDATGTSLKALRDELAKAKRAGPDDSFSAVSAEWPVPTARAFVEERYTASGVPTLRHWQDDFLAWDGVRYQPVSNADIRAQLYRLFEQHRVGLNGRGPVDNALDALKALVNVPSSKAMPGWLCLIEPAPAGELIAVRNGLLHIPSRDLLPHDPRFFTAGSVNVTFEHSAPPPAAWFKFLHEAFPNDQESIDALQQWFGYLLTQDTAQQKALICVGPKRCGKGTIARVLRALLGEHNCAGPTLRQLGEQFGQQGLIGRSLAVISDARVSGKADLQGVSETLLRITGEDAISVERKGKDDWVGKLTTRFVLMTNILPGIVDAGGAVASRFIVLKFSRSFFGREDTKLTDKLMAELPGILNWSLDGLAMLNERGAFIQPAAGVAAVDELIRRTTPILGFVADVLVLDPDAWISKDALYDCYKAWAADEGMKYIGQKNAFFTELYANSDGRLAAYSPRVGDARVKAVRGARLLEGWNARISAFNPENEQGKIEHA